MNRPQKARMRRQAGDWWPQMILAVRAVVALVVVTSLLAGCIGIHFPSRTTPPPATASKPKVGKPYRVAGRWYVPREDWNYDETGIASWYGRKFHGRRTANGEIFDMNKLTAAHRTLPLPSYVRVTNLENGRAINVRVNDRGPFVKGRIIDLSRRAAQLLGFAAKGTARVRVQIIRPDGTLGNRRKGKISPPHIASAEQLVRVPVFVQVGAFRSRKNAKAAKRRVARLGPARIEPVSLPGRTLYRVRIGPYQNLDKARRVLDRAIRIGFYEARLFSADTQG